MGLRGCCFSLCGYCMWEHESKGTLNAHFGALSELSVYERERGVGGGRQGEKARSGDLEGREIETDEKGSLGAEVTLRTRC